MFQDRQEAGRKLADQLLALKLPDPVVLALPRGGVPVAAEIAEALQAPLDVVEGHDAAGEVVQWIVLAKVVGGHGGVEGSVDAAIGRESSLSRRWPIGRVPGYFSHA